MKRVFNLLIIVLTLHILSVQTKLLYFLSPDNLNKEAFSFLSMGEHEVLSLIFAISYALATAFIIFLTERKFVILTYAFMDGLGVLLYYYSARFEFTAVYFAVYTSLLIASVVFIKPTGSLQDKVKKMRSKMSVKQIAKKTNLTENKIYKLLK